MDFRTQIPILKNNHPIDYDSRVVSLGSCFAVNISEKLRHFKFSTTLNPFGILFHPQALNKFITTVSEKKNITEKELFFHNECWHSFDVHSELSHPDQQQLINVLNERILESYAAITAASHVIITLGTAWIYRNNDSGEIVANCHKVPQKHFKKEILSIEAIIANLQDCIRAINEMNPEAQVIFTISPVRHSKDGFVENQRSKAHLIAALQAVLHQPLFENKTYYFPSYEVMMDELRDYRFYAEDMIHPSALAIDYIWSKFQEASIAEACYPVMKRVDAIQKSLAHRPFYSGSESHQKFIKDLHNKISQLESEYSQIVFPKS